MTPLVLASFAAIGRARPAILTIAATYALSLALGIAMVSTGNTFALECRDAFVGGAVSVDSQHQTRLAGAGQAAYYLVTLLLQLIPYSIAGGMGVQLGIGAWRALRGSREDTWLGLPKDRLRDVALAYIVITPLFLIASVWEFTVNT